MRIIDGAAGGLGGCPFAPGAAGNTASEDLVFAFEHMGVSTGVDFARLLAAADRVAASRAGAVRRQAARRAAPAGAVGVRGSEPRRAGRAAVRMKAAATRRLSGPTVAPSRGAEEEVCRHMEPGA